MTGLFARLRADAAASWEAYTRHRFVQGLGDGTLPQACFRHYLEQDYLFLIQFARCYALAACKAEKLADIRRAKDALVAILDVELDLHVAYCGKWGIQPELLESLPADPANAAYTDYVMDVGSSGGLLDLSVALVPCVQGYGEIGKWLAADPLTKQDGNPYADWIAMYAGEEYQDAAAEAATYLDALAPADLTEAEIARLSAIFTRATELEIGFWDMGLSPRP